MSRHVKLGLALSGGGARGAYEVGVIKALAARGIEPEVVTGASIGALNGAFVAASSDLRTAAVVLERIWVQLGQAKPIRFDQRYLGAAMLNLLLGSVATSSPQARMAKAAADRLFALSSIQQDDFHLFNDGPLREVLREHLDLDALLNGREFFVSVYEASDGDDVYGISSLLTDLLRYKFARDESSFERVKDFAPEEAVKLLMASAALPVAFRPVLVNGRRLRDGGMGDRITAQGNTPFQPLHDLGCTHALVVTIGDGAPFNRYEWRETTIVELRPSALIQDHGGGLDGTLLDFSPERIASLMKRGEADAHRSLDSLFKAIDSVQELRSAEQTLSKTIAELEGGQQAFRVSINALDAALDDRL